MGGRDGVMNGQGVSLISTDRQELVKAARVLGHTTVRSRQDVGHLFVEVDKRRGHLSHCGLERKGGGGAVGTPSMVSPV